MAWFGPHGDYHVAANQAGGDTGPCVRQHPRTATLVLYLPPLGCLALVRPRLLIAMLPELAVLLLSSFTNMQKILFHYPALVIAVPIIASVRGLAFLLATPGIPPDSLSSGVDRRLMTRRCAGVALCCLAAVSAWRILNFEGRSLPWLTRVKKRAYYEPEKRTGSIAEMGRLIPDNASVSVPLNLLNPIHPFAERPLIAFMPDRARVADYMIYDTATRFFGGYKDDSQDAHLAASRSDSDLELIFDAEGFVVFRRRDPLAVGDSDKRRLWIESGRFAR